MSKILVTGMSGTGKSTALVELSRRGYRVVDTDEAGWSDWSTSKTTGGRERLWSEERMTELLRSVDQSTLFVSGCVRNQVTFYDRFDAIVLLTTPAEVMLERVGSRTTNDFGKTSLERDQILRDLDMVEPLLRTGCTHELDARMPVDDIVTELIEIAREADVNGS